MALIICGYNKPYDHLNRYHLYNIETLYQKNWNFPYFQRRTTITDLEPRDSKAEQLGFQAGTSIDHGCVTHLHLHSEKQQMFVPEATVNKWLHQSQTKPQLDSYAHLQKFWKMEIIFNNNLLTLWFRDVLVLKLRNHDEIEKTTSRHIKMCKNGCWKDPSKTQYKRVRYV